MLSFTFTSLEQHMLYIAVMLLSVDQISLRKIPEGIFYPLGYCKARLLTFSFHTLFPHDD